MFTYVKLNNYRSLNNVTFDLKETREKTKKLIAIYGENGCGKSNLIRSFYFLEQLMHSFDLEKNEVEMTKLFEGRNENDIPLYIHDLIKKNTLSHLFKNSRTIDCNENTRLEFGFVINNHEGNYIVEFNDKIVYERLYYFTGKQNGTIIEISDKDVKNPKISNLIFKTSKIRNELKENIQKFWGKHSFLAITYDLAKKMNSEYINENISESFFDFHNMIKETSITLKEADGGMIVTSSKKISFISDLEKGDISIDNEWVLSNTERIINDFFTQTYADIRKVCFETEKTETRLKYHLVFYKNINKQIRKIPVEQESSGTRQILNILRNLFGAFCGCIVIIDEVDNGVHDLLLKVVIDSMKDYITGQLIFTTHNTSLLESLNPKMVYIINSKIDGEKEIICLGDFRIQDHNSPRIRYLRGLYGGIPFVDYVDYNEIVSNLHQKKE